MPSSTIDVQAAVAAGTSENAVTEHTLPVVDEGVEAEDGVSGVRLVETEVDDVSDIKTVERVVAGILATVVPVMVWVEE